MNRGVVSRNFDRGELIDVDTDTLREEFQRFRRQRRVSQAGVAALLNVSQATISSFEQGKHNHIRAKTLHGIYDVVQFWKSDSMLAARSSGSSRSVVRPKIDNSLSAGRCTRCGAGVPPLLESALFCPSCGNPLRASCACGHFILDAEAVYCSRCGGAVAEADADTLTRDRGDVRLALLRSVVRWIEHQDPISRILHDLSELATEGEET